MATRTSTDWRMVGWMLSAGVMIGVVMALPVFLVITLWKIGIVGAALQSEMEVNPLVLHAIGDALITATYTGLLTVFMRVFLAICKGLE